MSPFENTWRIEMNCSVPSCGKQPRVKGYCSPHYQRLYRHGDPLGGRTSKGVPLRFINEVAILHNSDECLIWPFGKNDNGYGTVQVEGKTAIASRYVCELVHGAPPTPEHDAAHSCGLGHLGCIAPGHLVWKTKAENQADRLAHGTDNRGERHGCAKLTEADVREIISLKGKETQQETAARFGVSRGTVSGILAGRTWAWLSEEVSV